MRKWIDRNILGAGRPKSERIQLAVLGLALLVLIPILAYRIATLEYIVVGSGLLITPEGERTLFAVTVDSPKEFGPMLDKWMAGPMSGALVPFGPEVRKDLLALRQQPQDKSHAFGSFIEMRCSLGSEQMLIFDHLQSTPVRLTADIGGDVDVAAGPAVCFRFRVSGKPYRIETHLPATSPELQALKGWAKRMSEENIPFRARLTPSNFGFGLSPLDSSTVSPAVEAELKRVEQLFPPLVPKNFSTELGGSKRTENNSVSSPERFEKSPPSRTLFSRELLHSI